MDVLLLRHGDAVDRLTGGYARDEDRPLTDAGRDEARTAALALARLGATPDLILTSPLVRATQTAVVVADTLGLRRAPEIAAALAPGADRAPLLAALPPTGTALLVGHMPDLGELAGWLCWGTPDATLPLRTGGLCRITAADPTIPGGGDLRWLLPPEVLRRIGG